MNWHAQQNDEPKHTWYPSLPIIPDVEQRWFTQEEIQRIIAAATGQYKVFFHLAGLSGLRSGELAGLHYKDIDFVRGVIRVRRSVWRGMEVSTKTKKGYRDVFVDSGTIQMLKEHLGDRTIGRVFQTRNGRPLASHNISSASAEANLQTARHRTGRYARISSWPCKPSASQQRSG